MKLYFFILILIFAFGQDEIKIIKEQTYFNNMISSIQSGLVWEDLGIATKDFADAIIPSLISAAMELYEETPLLEGEPSTKSLSCRMCSLFFDSLSENIIQRNQSISDSLAHICDIFVHNLPVCQATLDIYVGIATTAIVDRILTPNFTCGQILHICDVYEDNESIESYYQMVMADKPTNRSQLLPTRRSNYTVLQLTDTHWDENYVAGVNPNCGSPAGCCHIQDGPPPNGTDGCGYWGSLASSDLPLRTVNLTLQFIADNFSPDIIIWTGDSSDHEIWNQTQATQTFAAQVVAELMQKYLPNIPVVPQIGNHECYPVDECNLLDDQSNYVWESMNSTFSYWLNEEQMNQFLETGYYSYVDNVHNVKWIVLNTEAWDSTDYWNIQNPTNPLAMLDWLRDELYDCDSKNISAFIMGHIATGSTYALPSYELRYKALLERFDYLIMGQFFGHDHRDYFQMDYSSNNLSKPIGVQYLAPSLTTYSHLNPSFRIFYIDSDSQAILDMDQYRLNLTYWNEYPDAEKLIYEKVYTFCQEYNVPDMTPLSAAGIAEEIRKKNMEVLFPFYYNFYAGGYGYPTKLSGLDEKKMECMLHDNFLNNLKCMGIYNIENVDNVGYFLEDILSWLWYTYQKRNKN